MRVRVGVGVRAVGKCSQSSLHTIHGAHLHTHTRTHTSTSHASRISDRRLFFSLLSISYFLFPVKRRPKWRSEVTDFMAVRPTRYRPLGHGRQPHRDSAASLFSPRTVCIRGATLPQQTRNEKDNNAPREKNKGDGRPCRYCASAARASPSLFVAAAAAAAMVAAAGGERTSCDTNTGLS